MSEYVPTGGEEKKLWDKATAIFEELFNDLKSQNVLRLGTLQMDRERLLKIWNNSDEFGKARNTIFKILGSKQEAEEFSKKTGLSEETVVYTFLTQLISLILIEYESIFKTSLLFFLEEDKGIRRNMTLTQLLIAIEKISPVAGSKVRTLVDTELRNSLAHGIFWFEAGGKIFLAKDSYLQEVKQMTLADFMIESKKVNVISHALVHTLGNNIREGFFKL